MEAFLEKQGRNRTIALLSGFMGPDRTRFQGKWYRKPYMAYKYFTDLAIFVNWSTVLSHFCRTDISLIERCLGGFPLCSLSVAFTRIIYLHFARPGLERLVQGHMNSFENDPYPEHLESEIVRGRKYMRKFPIILFIFNVASMSPWCGAPFVAQYLTGERKMTVPADFPVPFEVSPYFEIITFIQILGATLTPLKIIASDDLFFAVAFHHLAIFRHMRHNFKMIFKDIRVTESGEVTTG